jgi:uncharacterized protein YyaL (SSP411 family)
LLALDLYVQKPKEILLISPQGNPINEYFKSIFRQYYPNKIVVSINENTEMPVFTHSLLKGKKLIDEKPTVYICHDFTCSQPICSIEEFEKYMVKE